MHIPKIALSALAALFMALSATPPASAQAPSPAPERTLSVASEAQAASNTVNAFHAALNAGNAEAVIKLLAPDAVILENGDVETREHYIAHHLPGDIKFAQAIASKRDKLEITMSGDVAWVHSSSTTQGTYQSKPLSLVGAELMVLVRTPSGWQIRAIHWSSRKSK